MVDRFSAFIAMVDAIGPFEYSVSTSAITLKGAYAVGAGAHQR